MEIAGSVMLIAAGLAMLGTGWRAGSRIMALGGAANVLAAVLILPQAAFGIRLYVGAAVLAFLLFLVFKSISREAWWSLRVELFLTGAVIAAIWTSQLLPPTIARELQLVLMGAIAVLTTVLIGLIIFRIIKEHFGHFPHEMR